MADGPNLELVLGMVGKMCAELVENGQEYFLVSVCPTKAMNIGSVKGRQFLDNNKDVIQRFLKHCYNTKTKVAIQRPSDGKETDTPRSSKRQVSLLISSPVKASSPAKQSENENAMTPKENSLQEKEKNAGKTLQLKEKDAEKTSQGKNQNTEKTLQGKETNAGKTLQEKETNAGKTLQLKENNAGKTSQGKNKNAEKTLQGKETNAGKTLQLKEKDAEKTSQGKNQNAEKNLQGKETNAGKTLQRKEKTAEKTLQVKKTIADWIKTRPRRGQKQINTDAETPSTLFAVNLVDARSNLQQEEVLPPGVESDDDTQDGDTSMDSGDPMENSGEVLVKVEAPDSDSSSPHVTADTQWGKAVAEMDTPGRSNSLCGMSLRTARKRKVFTDCVMPVKAARYTGLGDSDIVEDNSAGHSAKKTPKINTPGEKSTSQPKTRHSAKKGSLDSKSSEPDAATVKSKSLVKSGHDTEKASVKKSNDVSHTDKKTRKSAVSFLQERVKTRRSSSSAASVVSSNTVDKKETPVRSDQVKKPVQSKPALKTEKTSPFVSNERLKSHMKGKVSKSSDIDESDNLDYMDDSDEDFVVSMKVLSKDTESNSSDEDLVAKKTPSKKKRGRGKKQSIYHVCTTCGKSFKAAGALGHHMTLHSTECRGCGESFPDRETLGEHRVTCAASKRTDIYYPCNKCDLVCTAKWALRRHQIAAHEWRCRFCKKIFSTENEQDLHMETCIDKAVSENERRLSKRKQQQICPTCGKTFANKGILVAHMKSHKGDIVTLISDICGISVDQVGSIIDDGSDMAHAVSEGSPVKVNSRKLGTTSPSVELTCDSVETSFPCGYCEKIFYVRCDLVKHSRYFHPETYSKRSLYRNCQMVYKISCKHCNKTSSNQAWMKAHELTHKTIELNLTKETAVKDSTEETSGGADVNPSELTETSLKDDKMTGIKLEHCDQETEELEESVSGTEVREGSEVIESEVSSEGGSQKFGTDSVLLSSLKCKLCKLPFKNMEDLYSHANSHRVFQCHICQKYLSTAGTLKKHLDIAHSTQRDYMCELCGKSFKTPRCVRQHIQKVHNNPTKRKPQVGPFVCRVCSKVFAEKIRLTKHMYYHKDRTTACPVCEKCFPGKGEMFYHLKHVHSDARNYECNSCSRTYKTKASLREHKIQHHGDPSTWQYKCEDCGRLYSKKSQLVYHLKVHTGDRPFSCDQCEMCFSQKGNLFKHQQAVHIKKVLHTCEMCGKGFFLKENFQLHMRTHAVENGTAAIIGDKYGKISYCNICDKYFSRTCLYKTHVMLHKQEWKYSCPICKKKFVAVSTCTRHLKTHLKVNMTSMELREKFALKIGSADMASVKSEGMGHLLSGKVLRAAGTKVKLRSPEAAKIKVAPLKSGPRISTAKKSPSNVVRMIQKGSSPRKPIRDFDQEAIGASKVLEALASGSGDSEAQMTEVHIDYVQASPSREGNNVVALADENVIIDQENVTNVISVEEGQLVGNTMATIVTGEGDTATEEMSTSELEEILRTVNSEDFLQQLGSGNVILVEQGDTRAYVMLS